METVRERLKCWEVPITLGEGRDIFFFLFTVFRLTVGASPRILPVVYKWGKVVDSGLVVGSKESDPLRQDVIL